MNQLNEPTIEKEQERKEEGVGWKKPRENRNTNNDSI